MRTELIIKSQERVSNGGFSEEGTSWTYETSEWTWSIGTMQKISGSADALEQEGALLPGAEQVFRITVSGRTAGTLTVTDGLGGAITTISSNTSAEVTFTPTDSTLVLTASSTFDGSLHNVSVVATPEEWDLDMSDDVPVPLTFQIDSRDFLARKTPFSKKIALPGTNYNGRAFAHIYDLRLPNMRFNPLSRSFAVLKRDGVPVFEGWLTLDGVDITPDGYTFNTSLTSEGLDVIKELGEQTIKTLDFSEWDHTLTNDNIYGSWNGDLVRNGTPGYDNQTVTYTSPAITAETNTLVDGLNRMKITFASPHTFVAGDEVYVNSTGGVVDWSFDQVVYSVPSNTEIVLDCYDPIGFYGSSGGNVQLRQLDGEGYYYPCVDYGTYLTPASTVTEGGGLILANTFYVIKEYKTGDDFSNLPNFTFNGDGGSFTGFTFNWGPNNWTNGTILLKMTDLSLMSDDDALRPKLIDGEFGRTDAFWESSDFVPHIFLREVLMKTFRKARVNVECELFDTKMFRRLVIPTDQSYKEFNNYNASEMHMVETANVTMNDILPDTKLVDVVKSVLTMFNLVIIPTGDRNIKIVERRDLARGTDSVDWSSKLDGKLSIEFNGKDVPLKYHFKHADSEDYYNDQWALDFADTRDSSRRYGDALISTGSQHSKKIETLETSFEPSVMVGSNTVSIRGSGLFASGWTNSAAGDDFEAIEPERSAVPKLLIVGKRPSYLELISRVNQSVDYTLDYYPYAGHFDNYFQQIPSHDLNFDKPSIGSEYFIFFSDATLFPGSIKPYPTDLAVSTWNRNSLYNRYWKTFVEDSLLGKVSGRFKLGVSDVAPMDFERLYVVLGIPLRLEAVKDWDASGDGMCTCEFSVVS